MKTQVTLICGHDDNVARELRTRDWLEKHGASVAEWNGLQVISMLCDAPTEGQYRHEWVVGFDDLEGNQEQSYLSISLKADPYKTRIEVEYEGSYSCSCKGKGCNQCNDELAAIAEGHNPWQHHTAK
jgi:hypothetical protein